MRLHLFGFSVGFRFKVVLVLLSLCLLESINISAIFFDLNWTLYQIIDVSLNVRAEWNDLRRASLGIIRSISEFDVVLFSKTDPNMVTFIYTNTDYFKFALTFLISTEYYIPTTQLIFLCPSRVLLIGIAIETWKTFVEKVFKRWKLTLVFSSLLTFWSFASY